PKNGDQARSRTSTGIDPPCSPLARWGAVLPSHPDSQAHQLDSPPGGTRRTLRVTMHPGRAARLAKSTGSRDREVTARTLMVVFDSVYLTALAAWVGSVLFLSFGVAPITFKVLGPESAGRLVR